MRIEQPLDASLGQTALQHWVTTPAPVTTRRVQAIAQPATGEGTLNPGTPPDDGVELDLSPEGREAARKAALGALQDTQPRQDVAKDAAGTDAADAQDAKPSAEDAQVEPDAETLEKVQELSEQDREVRTREQLVRAMAGSRVVKGATYSYKVGPDGKLYAVDAELDYYTAEVPGNPRATLRKAEQLERAVQAATESSPEDRAAAAAAAALASRARQELQEEETGETAEA
jgi:hypothetical protein